MYDVLLVANAVFDEKDGCGKKKSALDTSLAVGFVVKTKFSFRH